MNILIVKQGATGDVVRTTTLLRKLEGDIRWLVEAKNLPLLTDMQENVSSVSWGERDLLRDRAYDLVINLEDSLETASFIGALQCKQIWGAYADSQPRMRYTDDSRAWFDLSIISAYGKLKADTLKLRNRQTYQDLIFQGLGFKFIDQKYLLPEPVETSASGDVAIAAEAGPVWPMKKWAFYDELKERLQVEGLTANMLPKRPSLLEHLSDVQNHRCLVSGDTLPMHLALGLGVSCVSLFTCTSPWEIYDYGIQKKIVSPLLEEFFYKRGYDERATTAISVEVVFDAVMAQLETDTPRLIKTK